MLIVDRYALLTGGVSYTIFDRPDGVPLGRRRRWPLGLVGLCFGLRSGLAAARRQAPRQILFGVHRQQRFDGDLGLLENRVGSRAATHSGWSRASALNRMKTMATNRKPRARPKMNPSVRSSAPTRLSSTLSDMRKVMRLTTISETTKTPAANTDLGDARLIDIGLEHFPIFGGEIEGGDGGNGPGEDRQHLTRKSAHHGQEARDEHDGDKNDVEPEIGMARGLLRRAGEHYRDSRR